MFQDDNWNVEEDFLEDFDADEVIKSLQNEKIEGTESESERQRTEKLPSSTQIESSDSDNKNSNSINETSCKKAILDIFKNNDGVEKDFKYSEKIIASSYNSVQNLQDLCMTKSNVLNNKKDLVLNIFNENNSVNTKNGTSGNSNSKSTAKSVLKVTEVDSDSENKLKRKKNVAFSESVIEAGSSKKMCISTNTDKIEETKNDDKQKQILLDILKFPAQRNVKVPITKKTVLRKFPGPAGLLDDNEEIETINVDAVDENKNKEKKYSDICSQNTKNLFTTGAWQLMMDDLPADFELQDIASVKDNALEYSKTYKKVPYIAGIVHSIDYKPNDPHVVLKDFSGKIDARIHHSICKLYPNALGTNVVILLKDVGVIVTSKKYVCIIISPNNLVSIYSDDSRLVSTTHLDKLTNINVYEEDDL